MQYQPDPDLDVPSQAPRACDQLQGFPVPATLKNVLAEEREMYGLNEDQGKVMMDVVKAYFGQDVFGEQDAEMLREP